MAKKDSRLTPVVNIAGVREKNAARELSEKIQLRELVREQLEKLQKYRDDYKKNSIVGKNHTPETLADFQTFLARLNKSIEGVERQFLEVERQLGEVSEKWQKSRVWTRSLEKAVERDLVRLESIESRKEQKDHDEIASRAGNHSTTRNH